jgi:hypothetical protein
VSDFDPPRCPNISGEEAMSDLTYLSGRADLYRPFSRSG